MMQSWHVALLVVIPGMVGGMISAASEYLDICSEPPPEPDDVRGIARHEERKKNRSHGLFFLGRGLFGLAGAGCVLVGGLWVQKLSFIDSVDNTVFLWALMLVSGVFSRRMVPVIGDQLERELMKRRITDTEKIANNAAATSNQAVSFTEAMSFAQTALSRADTTIDVPQAIQALNKVESDFPTHRTLHIYLGRLYKRLGDYDNAILCLRTFIKNLDKQTKGRGSAETKVDIADAYYNIACYHALKARQVHDAHEREEEEVRLKKESLESLRLSVEKSPENAELAKADKDFDFIKEDLGQITNVNSDKK